jgi:RNA methyltransferase, TrmH family
LTSIAASESPQGILAVVRIPDGYLSKELPEGDFHRILICEDIQDPGNIGALVRTASAFGFDGIILSEKCADPFGPKAVQASAGSLLSLWIRRTTAYLDLVDSLHRAGFTVAATHLHGTPDITWASSKKLVLMLGNEGSGLSGKSVEKADHLYRIPMNSNNIESLNVAASGAICMFLSSRPY